MEIINGKNLSQEILENLKSFFQKHQTALAVISVGDDSDKEVFIKQKQKAAAFLGIEFLHFHFDDKISNRLLREKVNEIARRDFIKGIIIQLPLPEKYNVNALVNVIPIEKDVDVLNERHFGQFALGRSIVLPPAVATVSYILEKYRISFQDKIFGIVGLSRLVGLPVSIWLLEQKQTVISADIYTQNPSQLIKNCDIVISGAGQPNLINKNWLKDQSAVIDFGFEKKDGKVWGDVDFESAKEKASYITPTPGGTGPILVAMIFKNLKELMESNFKVKNRSRQLTTKK
ncbi:MAG TPA: bifunctional 5,10-methylenetetrahydrofolate dehydrogenase/5,10-methenyltetrahydrofolate cyclohydrolase [Candidatus Paceibacterota bacterium]|nr:bifunctional 5,10-methylenetetrahydrofolate dehydrogenase/5,10-methenyltetrahydrofolate cyclohydrolase [Candidatus Paceibacterota bacterium]